MHRIALVLIFNVSLILSQTTEYDFKAAFVRKFIFFTDWPKNSEVYTKEGEFVIGVDN